MIENDRKKNGMRSKCNVFFKNTKIKILIHNRIQDQALANLIIKVHLTCIKYKDTQNEIK